VDTVEAVNEWLLFRPMSEGDDWDVLFPAKLSTQSNGIYTPQFEISHLTCFIGGMYALGGKIFDRKDDLEKAKQLTDGCVWAYSQTPSGLMPEWARVLPCPSLEKCEFNETQWWDALDQSREWRERELTRWLEAEAEEAELRRNPSKDLDSTSSPHTSSSDSSRFSNPLDTSDSLRSPGSADPLHSSESLGASDSFRSSDSLGTSESLRSDSSRPYSSGSSDSSGSSSSSKELNDAIDTSARSFKQSTDDEDDYSSNKVYKRGVIPSQGESSRDDDEVSILPATLKDRLGMPSDDDHTGSRSSTQETAKSDHRVESVSGSDIFTDDVRSNNIPDMKPDERERFPISEPVIFKPKKPLSHEEYVQDKIERENLPRGFTTIGSASYILR
jgi:hypothetical protein